MTEIGPLVRSANPVPDDSRQLTDDELGAVFLLVERRSGDMDAKELIRPIEPDKKPRRSGLLVAVGVFAVVVIGGVGIAFFLPSSTPSAPPATSPVTTQAPAPSTSTSTTVADASVTDDALTPYEETFVADFMTAFNAHDEASLMAVVTPDTNTTSYLLNEAAPSEWAKELAWRWALDEEWTAQSCKLAFSAISCQLTISGGWFEHLGPQTANLRMTVDGGVITSLTLREDLAVLIPGAAEFRAWMESAHPDDLAIINASGEPPPPRLTDESIALWPILIAEFEASLGG